MHSKNLILLPGVEREIGLDEFPSPEELFARYQKEINDGQGLSEAERTLINQPYYTSQNTYPPRYYQQVAINSYDGRDSKRPKPHFACYGNGHG